MAARAHTVRVSDQAWERFGQEAKREGVSTNQWIMEAALSRLVYVQTRRDDQIAVDFDTIFEALRELRDP